MDMREIVPIKRTHAACTAESHGTQELKIYRYEVVINIWSEMSLQVLYFIPIGISFVPNSALHTLLRLQRYYKIYAPIHECAHAS